MPQTVQEGTTKEILSGIAITVLLFSISIYLPLIGFISSALIPLPVLFYRLKLGRRRGSIIPIATFVLMSAVIGGMSLNLLFFGELLILGFVLSEFMAQNLSVEKTILYTSSVVLATILGGLLFYSSAAHTDLLGYITDYIGKNLKATLALYEQRGMPEEHILLIANSLEQIQYVLVRILPGLTTAAVLIVIWINLLAARGMTRKQGVFYPDFGPLNHWKVSDFLVWAVIGCGLMLLLPGKALNLVGLNGIIILMTVYFFQGIAIVSFYFEKRKFPPMLKLLCYSIIFLQQLLLVIIIGIGFFDMWLNFRKLEFNNNH